jgi:hypothetical protein
MAKSLSIDDYEYIDYNGIKIRCIYYGKQTIKYCATDICNHFKKNIKEFLNIAYGKAIPKDDIESFKGRHHGGTYLSKHYCDQLINWCEDKIVKRIVRNEKVFFDGLEILLDVVPYTEDTLFLIRQYRVKNYFIDGFLSFFGIAIEYDEAHHKKQKEEDKNRESEIRKLLRDNIKFIRVVEGKEIEGYRDILKAIMDQ